MAKLYLVPTPIGNLEDITLRALRILKECDLILAEDTRVSSKILKHYEIEKKVWAYHQHNEHRITDKVIESLHSGLNIALVSDAGTPGISDPGYYVVRAALSEGLEVETLPGATALIPALVNSGLPCDRFIFEGFLPHKKGRKTRLEALKENAYTTVLYESPYRLLKLLAELKALLGNEHPVSVSRELSKLHEESVRGSLSEVEAYFRSKDIKGEFVVVLGGVKQE